MKKIFRSSIAILCVCVLAVVVVALTGCGKGGDQSADTSAATPAATPSAPGNGSAANMPGLGGPSAPAGAPAAPAATPVASATPSAVPTGTAATATGADESAGGFPKIAFSAVKKNSPIKVVTDKQNGLVIKFLRFKYSDWNGAVNICELPEVESKAMHTAGNWVVTFDAYKIISATAKTSKKKVRARLTDFPFISPKPTAGQGLPSIGSGLNSPGGSGSSNGLMLPGT